MVLYPGPWVNATPYPLPTWKIYEDEMVFDAPWTFRAMLFPPIMVLLMILLLVDL